MISLDISETIRQQLAGGVSVQRDKEGASYSIYVPFVFDDGDPCGFQLIRVSDNAWRLSDGGTTIRRASYSGADLLVPGHIERLHKITGFYGLFENRGALEKPIEGDDFADPIFTFTQACLEIINLAKLPRERSEVVRSDFSGRLESIVARAIPDQSLREHNWHHPKHDPEKVYTVDYRIQGSDSDWFLFGVNSPMSAMRATVACYHYKKARIKFKSLAIYDREERLSPRDTLPLNEITDKTFPRIRERASIREFLESIAA